MSSPYTLTVVFDPEEAEALASEGKKLCISRKVNDWYTVVWAADPILPTSIFTWADNLQAFTMDGFSDGKVVAPEKTVGVATGDILSINVGNMSVVANPDGKMKDVIQINANTGPFWSGLSNTIVKGPVTPPQPPTEPPTVPRTAPMPPVETPTGPTDTEPTHEPANPTSATTEAKPAEHQLDEAEQTPPEPAAENPATPSSSPKETTITEATPPIPTSESTLEEPVIPAFPFYVGRYGTIMDSKSWLFPSSKLMIWLADQTVKNGTMFLNAQNVAEVDLSNDSSAALAYAGGNWALGSLTGRILRPMNWENGKLVNVVAKSVSKTPN